MLFDSHCHLDFPEFDADRSEVLARARARGVAGMLVAGVTPGQWPRLLRLTEQQPEVFAALGVHPWYADRVVGRDLDGVLQELALRARSPSVVALGECGLDRVAVKRRGVSWVAQSVLFERQVALACELALPLVLHVVRAHAEALALLRRHAPLPAAGVVHGYTGSPELFAQYAELGLYCGVGTAVLFAGNAKLRLTVRSLAPDRLLLETDAPDRPPPWSETRRNEPGFLVAVAEQVASLRGVTTEQLRAHTTLNARRLFRLPVAPG